MSPTYNQLENVFKAAIALRGNPEYSGYSIASIVAQLAPTWFRLNLLSDYSLHCLIHTPIPSLQNVTYGDCFGCAVLRQYAVYMGLDAQLMCTKAAPDGTFNKQ